MAVMKAVKGLNPGQLFVVEGDSCVLGRHPDCDIVLDVRAVSREHARVVQAEDVFYIEDLKSRNGTFLNDEQISGRRKLREDDEIRICDVVFAFHHGSSESTRDSDREGVDESEAMMIDDARIGASSTITSKIDISSGRSGLRLTVNAEGKLQALLEIMQNLGSAVGTDEVLPKLLDNLFAIFIQADRGFIVLKDEKSGRLIPAAVKHRREEDAEQIRISRTIVNSVMSSKEAVLSADAAVDSRFGEAASIVDFQIHSMMCAPLIGSEDKVLGVLQIDTSDQRNRFTPEDLEVLASVGCHVAVSVENAQLHEVRVQEEAYERELSLGRKIQLGFLPDKPPEVEGYEFFDYYDPARHLGGDYFNYMHLPDGRLAVILADVSGKGVSAALLMAVLSAETRVCLATEPDPAKAIANLNEIFCESSWEDRFVTMLVSIIDLATNEVTLINAGHMAPILRHSDATIEEVGQEAAGLPVGVVEEMEYDTFTLKLEPGDSLTVYTDGIPDAMNMREEFYGTERFLKELSTPSADGVVAIGKRIIDQVKRFAGDQTQSDDMCVTMFGRMA